VEGASPHAVRGQEAGRGAKRDMGTLGVKDPHWLGRPEPRTLAMMDLEARVSSLLAQGAFDDAAATVIDGYGPAILGYVCSLWSDGDDARDVFSMWAEDLWKGMRGFRGECSVRAWAYRIAWHAAARYRRDAYRQRREQLPASAASRLADTVRSAMKPDGRHAALRKLRAALDPEEQTLLVLRVDKDLSWEEVAAVLSAAGERVEVAALRKRFERLRDRLAALARDEGLVG
jgi:RNA polymerase sigma-70 factor (ECF subfamily)